MRYGIIYKATNIKNNKSYVGQTIDFDNRKLNHKQDAFNKKRSGYNYHFHRAIRKYGWNNFVWEIICDYIPEQYLYEYENWYVDFYGTYKYGYNSTEGGDVNPMIYPELRKKISIKLKGR